MDIFPFNVNSSSCRNLSSASDSKSSNDLESKRNSDAKTSDKLRVILNNLGMSMSQWTIQENDKKMNFVIEESNPPSTGSTRGRARRRMSVRKGDTKSIDDRDANPYQYNHSSIQPPRQNSEEFDDFNNYAGSHSTRRRGNQMINTEDIISARLRVRAVHAASNINITKVLTAVFGPTSKTPSMSHVFGKTSIIVQLPPVVMETEKHEHEEIISPGKEKDKFFHSPESQPRFVALFKFGSIVFFNISAKDALDILESVKKHSVDPVPRGFERKEHFEIAVAPKMQDTAHVNADFVTVKELDINNVAVVSTIMGQTVAFDSYNDTVDELLGTFESINATVKRTGNFTAMERETLFKVVAQNNSLIIEMIARLGIKDRSDTAWNLSQYERLHDGMKVRLEIIEFRRRDFDHLVSNAPHNENTTQTILFIESLLFVYHPERI